MEKEEKKEEEEEEEVVVRSGRLTKRTNKSIVGNVHRDVSATRKKDETQSERKKKIKESTTKNGRKKKYSN